MPNAVRCSAELGDGVKFKLLGASSTCLPPCTLLFFATPDQRVALIKARIIMPTQFERRNARLYLCPAGGLEKGIDAPSRP